MAFAFSQYCLLLITFLGKITKLIIRLPTAHLYLKQCNKYNQLLSSFDILNYNLLHKVFSSLCRIDVYLPIWMWCKTISQHYYSVINFTVRFKIVYNLRLLALTLKGNLKYKYCINLSRQIWKQLMVGEFKPVDFVKSNKIQATRNTRSPSGFQDKPNCNLKYKYVIIKMTVK